MKKIVKVEWYDACSKSLSADVLKSLNLMRNAKHLLEINTTYGLLFKKFKDVTVVFTETSLDSDNEVTIIPNVWIKKITILKDLE